ncbi:hypothetical protein [Maribacter sp. HTCC2170]|uniref:hypothetical protein n=1 Tax=Maribacter sp. (strain HTCC2170 / KCCM 42371) TaxID=313603 RepID=UPI00006BD4B6|nr:hypothetical protein [Maribacter sp. HTCC2170]EAR02064.1 hypothetical protein FB2170_02235 [Maribacter sp. HTCC2170]
MKKRIWVVLLLFLGIVLGCSKNSNDDPKQSAVDKTANLKATGSSANDILSNTNFDKLQIEIAYVDGFRPTTSAMTDFVNFLETHSFKQNIELIYKELPSPNEAKLTLDEIVELEDKNRTIYNDGSTLAIYIYFADAPSEDDKEEEDLVTLGAVYLNTSMVIYEDTIRTLASKSNLISVGDVETATLNHEFGHLLGLVDLGSTPVNGHEDVDSENHCNVEGCLMRAELQFGAGMKKMLEKRASKGFADAPGLDPECILDLQTNGGR